MREMDELQLSLTRPGVLPFSDQEAEAPSRLN
jgi:hypothetical protein